MTKLTSDDGVLVNNINIRLTKTKTEQQNIFPQIEANLFVTYICVLAAKYFE